MNKESDPAADPLRRGQLRHGLCAVLLVGLGLGLRLWSAFGGDVDPPIRGDAVQYCAYAWQLVHSHTFSMSESDAATVIPDSYRDPGYPLLLAVAMSLGGAGQGWYQLALLLQSMLGAATVGLTYLIGRSWLHPRPALAATAVTALWPHLVVISGYLLSEALLGFMLALALWWFSRLRRNTPVVGWMACGVVFGAAALVNVTITPFGPLLAGWMLWRGDLPRRLPACLLAGSLLLPAAWQLRALDLPPASNAAPGRAAQVLVQGSWPDYHAAFTGVISDDPAGQAIMDQINGEAAIAQRSPLAWLGVARRRMAQEPLRYVLWYAWKPALLWAWSIRVGWGDIYPFNTQHPIYMTQPLLRLSESLCVGLNPLLFLLMAAAVAALLMRTRKGTAAPALFAIALLLAQETAIYSLLQSQPRYSIPLRPFEMLLAVSALVWLMRRWRARNSPGVDVAAA